MKTCDPASFSRDMMKDQLHWRFCLPNTFKVECRSSKRCCWCIVELGKGRLLLSMLFNLRASRKWSMQRCVRTRSIGSGSKFIGFWCLSNFVAYRCICRLIVASSLDPWSIFMNLARLFVLLRSNRGRRSSLVQGFNSYTILNMWSSMFGAIVGEIGERCTLFFFEHKRFYSFKSILQIEAWKEARWIHEVCL
jgi:hypothetical protein